MMIYNLNLQSVEIANVISQKVKRFLQRYTVSTEIAFHEGSLVIVGTILLTTWAFFRPIVEESVKKAVEPELTQVIQFAVKRGLSRALPNYGISLSQPIQTDVLPVTLNTSANQQSTPQPDQAATASTAASLQPAQSGATSSEVPQQTLPQYLRVMTLINTIGIIIILIVLLLLLLVPHITFK